jgi:zinc D-Ala-D-Ala dipeptidase
MVRSSILVLLGIGLCLASPGRAAPTDPAPTDPAAIPGLVDAATVVPHLGVDLKYASTDNFMHKNVYGDLKRCYLQRSAAEKLAAASKALRARRADLHLLAYDCARPLRVQQVMWRLVKGTPNQRYVADPRTGSMHNYGCAVDLTLADAKDRPLDLGTPFDTTGERAQPRLDIPLLKAGKLTPTQLANRLLLRLVMVQGGFFPLDIEWWHFDCALPDAAKKRFTRVP